MTAYIRTLNPLVQIDGELSFSFLNEANQANLFNGYVVVDIPSQIYRQLSSLVIITQGTQGTNQYHSSA